MREVFKTFSRYWVKSPVKITLTLVAVSLGTAILILSFSAGEIINKDVLSLMNREGVILNVVNGEWGDNGQIEQQRPTSWDGEITDFLISDSDSIEVVSIINNFPIPYLFSDGNSYQFRNIVSTDPSYLDIYSLEIIAGSRMSQKDYDSGVAKIWISETTAQILYGSIDEAIGKRISPPGSESNNRRGGFQISQFSVAGVYRDPSEILRKAYGVADAIFPITSILNSGSMGSNNLDWLSGKLLVKSSSNSIEKVISEINQIVASNYGIDTEVASWEGNSRGETTYLNDLRQTVSIFTTSINILGIVILITSSLGIFSIMVVEALGRKKEIAIERALGASKSRIIGEFWQWSITLSLMGAIIGLIISLLLSSTILGTINPLLQEFSSDINISSSIQLKSVLLSIVMALGFGGVLGVLPAFSTVKGSISESFREA